MGNFKLHMKTFQSFAIALCYLQSSISAIQLEAGAVPTMPCLPGMDPAFCDAVADLAPGLGGGGSGDGDGDGVDQSGGSGGFGDSGDGDGDASTLGWLPRTRHLP